MQLSSVCAGVMLGAFAAPAMAASLTPVSYTMLNGNTGDYEYHDSAYNGTGDVTQDRAPLSGGVGELTDGVISTEGWTPRGFFGSKDSPYVGWKLTDSRGAGPDGVVNSESVDIAFDFGREVTITSFTLHGVTAEDDISNGVNAPDLPDIVSFGAAAGDNPQSIATSYAYGAYSHMFQTGGLTGQNFVLRLALNDTEPFRIETDWVLLSEISFAGNAVTPAPLPATALMLAAALGAFGALRRRG